MLHRRIQTLATAALLGAAGAAAAADVPNRPVRIIVPFVAGASYDTITRIVGEAASAAWGQPIVIDNRAGASGIIGAELAARSAPDGHTLAMLGNNHTILAALRPNLPYDLFKSFEPVGRIAVLDNVVVVHPSVPAKNLKELIALLKSNPGKYRYGSGGVAGSTHLAGALFTSLTGTDVLHVPYKGGGLAVNGLLGGEVQMMTVNMISARPQVGAGKLRALAVAAEKRSPHMPDVPTTAEAGLPGYLVSQFYGLLAPAKTPKAVVAKLNADFRRAAADPGVIKKLALQGATAYGETPEQFAAFLKADVETNRKIARDANIKAK